MLWAHLAQARETLHVPIPLYFQRNVNKAGNVILDMDFKGREMYVEGNAKRPF